MEYFRSPGRISANNLGGDRNLFTEKTTVRAESNAPAVRDALKYCQAAIKELEILKLSPALDLQKIEALKTGIPDISIFQEVQGERPLPGLKGVNPLHLLPSESEMNWKLGGITEKFKKLMGNRID